MDRSASRPSPTAPELRVLCRRLTTTPPAQLPAIIPSLQGLVLRCKAPLSSTTDAKAGDQSAEVSRLVHQLKTVVTSHLNGKTPQGRLAAAALIKPIVEVGGRECLKTCGPWINGLLALFLRKDPPSSKALAIITTTKIYVLLQQYPTLSREMATPTIKTFISSCIQLLQPAASAKSSKPPENLVRTIFDAFTALLTHYSTIFRPFVAQIRGIVRSYVAPTSSDEAFVSETVAESSRALSIALHATVAQGGGSEEWSRIFKQFLKDSHLTAGLIFRVIEETWETSGPFNAPAHKTDLSEPPFGGGSQPQDLPPWVGTKAGSERLAGCLSFLATALRQPTKVSVNVPVGACLDLATRILLLSRASHAQAWDQALETVPGILKEEKDELWTALPGLHAVALRLILALLERFEMNTVPLIQETMDSTARALRSSIDLPEIRQLVYEITTHVLNICGPATSNSFVEMIGLVTKACCRDLFDDVGLLEDGAWDGTISSNRKTDLLRNPDSLLESKSSGKEVTKAMPRDLIQAAQNLHRVLLERLPPGYLKAGSRELLDATAIFTQSEEAMLASLLNPYHSSRNEGHVSIMPYFAQRYPHSQGLELLRAPFRTSREVGGHPLTSNGFLEVAQEDEPMLDLGAEPRVDSAEHRQDPLAGFRDAAAKGRNDDPQSLWLLGNGTVSVDEKQVKGDLWGWTQPSADAEPKADGMLAESRQEKRKNEEPDLQVRKKQETAMPRPLEKVDNSSAIAVNHGSTQQSASAASDNDSDDESVHLNMEFDDDESGSDAEGS